MWSTEMAGQVVAPKASAPKQSSGSFIPDLPSFRYPYANSAENATGFRSKVGHFPEGLVYGYGRMAQDEAAVEAEAGSAGAQPAWE